MPRGSKALGSACAFRCAFRLVMKFWLVFTSPQRDCCCDNRLGLQFSEGNLVYPPPPLPHAHTLVISIKSKENGSPSFIKAAFPKQRENHETLYRCGESAVVEKKKKPLRKEIAYSHSNRNISGPLQTVKTTKPNIKHVITAYSVRRTAPVSY